jgi:predicted ATPase
VRLTSDRLVGRDDDLSSAMAAVRRVPNGCPGVVMVSGPAGIGKTRFLATFAEQLRADGIRTMVGGPRRSRPLSCTVD